MVSLITFAAEIDVTIVARRYVNCGVYPEIKKGKVSEKVDKGEISQGVGDQGEGYGKKSPQGEGVLLGGM